MIDDTDLGFFANFLGIFIFVFLVAYHYVVAEPKYETQWGTLGMFAMVKCRV